jgi:hypothetical protein
MERAGERLAVGENVVGPEVGEGARVVFFWHGAILAALGF